MAKESLYDRSAWGYVFERVCHADSPYTANQRLVLLALAKHMGRRNGQSWLCFVNDRLLQAETGLKRTAVKAARRGIRTIAPPIVKLERPPRGGRLKTNGIAHGCYRYVLLHTPRHQVGQPKVTLKDLAPRLMEARAEQLDEFVNDGLPRAVAEWVLATYNRENLAQLFVDEVASVYPQLALSILSASSYRSCDDPRLVGCWKVEFDQQQNVLLIDGNDLPIDEVLQRASSRARNCQAPNCESRSPDDAPDGRHATT